MVLRSLQRDRDFKNFYRHSNCYILFTGIICLLIETHPNSIIYANPYHFNPSVFFKSIQRYWHLGPQHNAFSISTSTSLSPLIIVSNLLWSFPGYRSSFPSVELLLGQALVASLPPSFAWVLDLPSILLYLP